MKTDKAKRKFEVKVKAETKEKDMDEKMICEGEVNLVEIGRGIK